MDAPNEPPRSTATGARPATVALCVTGSVAAYKAAELARLLIKGGATVLPVMTTSSMRFIGALTLAAITSEPVASDMWDASASGEIHVALSRRSDVVAIVPATADVIARLAQGRADDLVTALALCARGPVVIAPAMHPRMWEHPATQRNVASLVSDRRVTLVGPVSGDVASGDHGLGRMAEPADIAAAIVAAASPKDLAGLRVVVTAGPTVEDIDAVRFIGNRSTGRMGFALAARAAARGADVTLVAGPVILAGPPGVRRVDVRDTAEMREALWQALGSDLCRADVLLMAAAVADYRPLRVHPGKMKKGDATMPLALVKTPDLLAEIGAARVGERPLLVGFALETAAGEALVSYARRKLHEKHVDLVVANLAGDSFGLDDNRATLVSRDATEAFPTMPKGALADLLLDRVKALRRS